MAVHKLYSHWVSNAKKMRERRLAVHCQGIPCIGCPFEVRYHGSLGSGRCVADRVRDRGYTNVEVLRDPFLYAMAMEGLGHPTTGWRE